MIVFACLYLQEKEDEDFVDPNVSIVIGFKYVKHSELHSLADIIIAKMYKDAVHSKANLLTRM